MRTIIPMLIVCVLAGPARAGLVNDTPVKKTTATVHREASMDPLHRPPVDSIVGAAPAIENFNKRTGLPAAAGDDGIKSSPPKVSVGGPSAVMGAVQQMLEPVIQAPVRNALDEAVMETNALAPLIPLTPAALGPLPAEGEGGRRGEPGEGSLPSLHGLVGQWMSNSSPVLDPELSGGIAMFRVGGYTDAAPAVAIRFRPSPLSPLPAEGEGGRLSDPGEGSRWGLEIGSILPHQVSGAFTTADQTQGSTQGPITYNARLSSFYEIHAAAIHNLLPSRRQALMPWAVPEIGLGLSFLHAVNEVQKTQTYTYSYTVNGQTVTDSYLGMQFGTDRRWSVSPLVRLGIVLFPQSLFSLRMDVSYVPYANAAHAFGQTFDLGLSGLMIQEMLQVRL